MQTRATASASSEDSEGKIIITNKNAAVKRKSSPARWIGGVGSVLTLLAVAEATKHAPTLPESIGINRLFQKNKIHQRYYERERRSECGGW